jgi:hypothetical protein
MTTPYREFHFSKVREAIEPLGGVFPSWLKAAEAEEHPADHVWTMAEMASFFLAHEFARADADRIELLEEAIVALRECGLAMEELESA